MDFKDECPKEPGVRGYKGCPPPPLGIEVSPTFVYSRGSLDKNTLTEGLPGSNTLVNHENSTFNNSFVSFGLEISLFPNNGRIGIGTGFLFQSQDISFGVNGFNTVIDKRMDNQQREYKKILSVTEIDESVSANYLALPLMIKFRSQPGAVVGLGFYAEAGLLLPLSINNPEAASKATFDHEARYIFNPSLGDAGELLLTRSALTGIMNDSEIEAYFAERQKAGYDVALNDVINSTTEFGLGRGIGLLARAGVRYTLNESLGFMAGVVLASDRGSQDTSGPEEYILSGEAGEYNAILPAATQLNSTSFGLHLGISLDVSNVFGPK